LAAGKKQRKTNSVRFNGIAIFRIDLLGVHFFENVASPKEWPKNLPK